MLLASYETNILNRAHMHAKATALTATDTPA